MNYDLRKIFIKNLWRWKCGLSELSTTKRILTYEELEKSEWSDEFIQLMRNRLILGAFRYGLFRPGEGPTKDNIKAAHKRLDLYVETGNLEYLVDASNFALAEYVESNHPKKHFHAVDDGEHAK